ncbi:hypothetical protein D3C81_974100 [compost metagenome]
MRNQFSKYDIIGTCYILYGDTNEDSIKKTKEIINGWNEIVNKDSILNKRRKENAV